MVVAVRERIAATAQLIVDFHQVQKSHTIRVPTALIMTAIMVQIVMTATVILIQPVFPAYRKVKIVGLIANAALANAIQKKGACSYWIF